MNKTSVGQPQWEDLVIPKSLRGAAAPLEDLAGSPVKPSQAPAKKSRQPVIPACYLTHELRAPVTAIRLGLEILQEQISGRLEADEKHMLCVAVKNTGRLEGLVNDIMDFSKIVAGKMKVYKEPCNARELIDEAADGLRATALAAGVKLVKEEGEPLPRVSAEPRRIVQILTNLIANAIKFTPARGTVTVSVKKGRFEHEGTLVFKVKDNGCGIPEKDLHTVFDMFSEASLNSKMASGTGLGLTLARMMAEIHGGRIWAESWKGAGSTFYFTIPISAEDLVQKIKVYPKPLEYTGLLVSFARRINAFLALFV